MIELYWSKMCLLYSYYPVSSAAEDQKWAGASSNMTDFRFCEVQNRREKCCSLDRKMMWSPKKKRKKKVFRLHMLISQCHFDGPAEANGLPEPHGPPKAHVPRGHCTSLPPLSAALPVSIDNTQHYILRHCLPIIQGCNQNFVKGVSLSASTNTQKNDTCRTTNKMAIIFDVRFGNNTVFQLLAL